MKMKSIKRAYINRVANIKTEAIQNDNEKYTIGIQK